VRPEVYGFLPGTIDRYEGLDARKAHCGNAVGLHGIEISDIEVEGYKMEDNNTLTIFIKCTQDGIAF
jgi:hypothetical protein